MSASVTTTTTTTSCSDDLSSSQTLLTRALPDEEQTELHIGDLPEEMLLNILSCADIRYPSLVCKQWRRITTSLLIKNNFTILSEKAWKRNVDLDAYEMTLDDAPAIDRRVKNFYLDHMFSNVVQLWQKVTLLTMPKGLTLKKINQCFRDQTKGNPSKIVYLANTVTHANFIVEKTYHLLITNQLIEGTVGESLESQKAKLGQLKCGIPTVLEAATLALFTLFQSNRESPEIVLPMEKNLYTCTTDTILFNEAELGLVVGGNCSGKGLHVFYSWPALNQHQGQGTLAVMRLPTSDLPSEFQECQSLASSSSLQPHTEEA